MKIIGPFIVFLGLSGITFALFEFLTLEGFEQPKYFWLFFVSMPFVFIGFILTGVGYRKNIQKLNEDILRDQMRAAGQGLKEGLSDSIQYCSDCGHSSARTSKFCSECGKSLIKNN